ncbi:MAG: LemA family protein [Bacteroidota bacterium]|nr:LemA family protein [Bacteroidota bacterium]
MKKGTIILLVIVGLFAVTIMSGISGYNSLVTMEENVDSKWSQVENVYQRRADLIPNLVNTVKGYANHEKETLQGVIEARSKATSVNVNTDNLSPQAIKKFEQAQSGLKSALSRLMVVVEKYPDLKANQNFRDLQAQLEGTENRITVERMKFNNAAKEYNASIRHFPKVLYASAMGFDKKAYFESSEGAETAPTVQF